MNASKQVCNKWNDNDCLIIFLCTFLNTECHGTFSFVPSICEQILRHINVLLSLLYHRCHNQNNTILCSRYLTSKNIRSTYLYSNLKCLFEKKMSLFSQSRKPLKVIRAVSIMLLIRFSMVAAVVRKLDRNG